MTRRCEVRVNFLERLHTDCGTSFWLDSVRRAYLRSGRFDHLAKCGIRGAIGYPTMFEPVVWGSSAYEAQLSSLARRHLGTEEIYWEMIISDVTAALARLQPIHEASGGDDGFVVIDLPPGLAHDATGMVATARALHGQIRRPNLLLRIPATDAGLRAITRLTASGLSVAVDVIDSGRYPEVMEGYLSGLESCPGDLSGVHGVAAFDLARPGVARSDVRGGTGGGADLGTSRDDGVALARRASSVFRSCFSGPRWERLAGRGATPQRPLWFPPPSGPGRSSAVLAQSLAGRDCIVAVSNDTATALERPADPAGRHSVIDGPRHAMPLKTVTDTRDENLARAQEDSALDAARRAYDAVLAALAVRVSASD